LRSDEHARFQWGKVDRALEHLQANFDMTADFDMCSVAAGCALDWFVMRFGRDRIFAGREALLKWHELATVRPSMVDTAPQ
jgi:hypothetical protein